MELATNVALRTPQRPATAGELDARKDTLASAIRRYQAVRRTVPSDDQLAMVAAAEDNLIDAWRQVIDLEERQLSCGLL